MTFSLAGFTVPNCSVPPRERVQTRIYVLCSFSRSNVWSGQQVSPSSRIAVRIHFSQIVSSCVTISWCYSDDQQGASRELARCLPQLFLVSCYCVRWRVYCNDTAKPLYKHKTTSQHLLLVSYSHITPWHTSSTQWMEDLFSFLLTLQPRVKWWETRDVVRETCVNV